MPLFVTMFDAVNPDTGELETWMGEEISANSFEEAEEHCRKFKGHLRVTGRLHSEIPTDSNYNPIWEGKIDHNTKLGLN